MKKALFKLSFLALALVSISYMSHKDVAARTRSTCIDNISAYYAHFVTCDNQWYEITSQYDTRVTDCTAEANTACGSSSNQPCWNNHYNDCEGWRNTQFSNKASIYSSCAYGDENCEYQIQDFCSTAFSQAYTCGELYYNTGNYDEYSACYWASKYWTCF